MFFFPVFFYFQVEIGFLVILVLAKTEIYFLASETNHHLSYQLLFLFLIPQT